MTDEIRPLQIRPITAEGEAERRYGEALKVLQRCVEAFGRKHYEDGETLDEAMCAARDVLDEEALEKEIFGDPKVDVFTRPECIFQYCPQPKICRVDGCRCPAESQPEATVPTTKSVSGRFIPDLRRTPHVCEWQNEVKASAPDTKPDDKRS